MGKRPRSTRNWRSAWGRLAWEPQRVGLRRSRGLDKRPPGAPVRAHRFNQKERCRTYGNSIGRPTECLVEMEQVRPVEWARAEEGVWGLAEVGGVAPAARGGEGKDAGGASALARAWAQWAAPD